MQSQKLISVVATFNDAGEEVEVQLHDFAYDVPSQRTFKDNGSMVAPCTIARVGIMDYRAKDCNGLFNDRDPESIVKVATLEEDLFDPESLESYRSAPVTINHPKDWVTPENTKELQKGNLDAIPYPDGENLAGLIVINDAEALKLVGEGVSQLSSSHKCVLKLAEAGLPYDAYKTKIRANHIAIVPSGRAKTAKIADAADDTIVAVLSDAEILLKEVEVKLADAEALLGEAEVKLADAAAENALLVVRLEASAVKLADANTQLSDVESNIGTMVQERIQLVSQAATLSDIDITGMDSITAKRAVVAQIRDKDVSKLSDSMIEAYFQVALEDSDDSSPMSTLLSKVAADVTTKLSDSVVVSASEQSRLNMITRNSKGKA